MRRPLSLLPALAAVAVSAVAGLGSPSSAAATAPATDDPLEVHIDTLTPSSVPARGPVRVRGTVTNVSDERWQAINVHAFMSDVPITSAAELAEATQTPVDAEVGDRITIPGTFDPVGALAPGETVDFAIRLRRDQLPVSGEGVYWFGAHALGNTDEARDGIADGRARTFLPLVDARGSAASRRAVRASVVLPVRHPIRHRPNGSLRGSQKWGNDLAPGGRLDTLLDLATAPGAGPVTWLLDPAVPDAVGRLVAGNPPRSLSDTIEQQPGEGDSGESESSAPAAPVDDDEATTEVEPDPDDPVAAEGAAWLDDLRSALATDEVLALPYGDPDLAASAEHDPAFYDRAAQRPGSQLERWQVATSPAVSSPSGFVSPGELGMLERDETVIASDRALPGGGPHRPTRIEGHRVLFASSETAVGGPGPEDPLDEIALRQRILADAALRFLFHDHAPLVVVLPSRFQPAQPEQFWSGLDADWLALGDTDELAPRGSLAPDDLDYPVDQELSQLDAGAFRAADDLIAAGRTLEGLLTNNDRVADQVLDEALTSVSYDERARPVEAQAETVRSTRWIDTRLEGVRIRAPRGVTLSSASGNFAATISNRLPHPVTVSVTADTQGDVTVEPPALIQLTARGRQTVVLEASAGSPGVHYVRLRVTDADGTPLGAGQRVPIRSAQVSQVIWVILGVGVGLLFLAITIRVVRRVRNEVT